MFSLLPPYTISYSHILSAILSHSYSDCATLQTMLGNIPFGIPRMSEIYKQDQLQEYEQ